MHTPDQSATAFGALVCSVWFAFLLGWLVTKSRIVSNAVAWFRRQVVSVRVLAVCALLAIVAVGGGKGDGGGNRGGADAPVLIPRPPAAQPRSGDSGATNAPAFRFTSFAVDGDEFQFCVEWPATNLADYTAIDVFYKRHLDDPAWRWVHRKNIGDPEDLSTEFAVYGNELPYWEYVFFWVIQTNAYEVTAPFGAVYTNLVAYVESPAEPLSGFFLAANQHDSDMDGAPDAVEQSLSLDPHDPDMDGDGLPDGRELALGASPLLTDTDGDGLPDGDEAAWGEASTNGVTLWIDIASATNHTVLFTDVDDDVAHLALPFGLPLFNSTVTNLSVDANGLVAVAANAPALDGSDGDNDTASYIPVGENPAATVAAFWDDLCVRPSMNSTVSYAVVGSEGVRTAVVEFSHIGFFGETTNDFVSFQVQFSEAETNTARVVFGEASRLGTGASATLATRTSRHKSIQYAYNEAGAVFPGLALTYHFGLGSDPSKADTDGDGLSDAEEIAAGTDPCDVDTDDDGLSDGQEVVLSTNPFDSDTDGDDLKDGAEVVIGTDPLDSDTDGDGLFDGLEVYHGLDPTDAADSLSDADGDGLTVAQEILLFGTNPFDPDTDNDGLADGQEVTLGTDPLDSDTDGDECPDGWEVLHGFDPLDDTDPVPDVDTDRDGLSTLEEAEIGTNPFVADTDGDGLFDGEERGCVFAATQPPFDMTGATNVLGRFQNLDNGVISLPLPFAIRPGMADICSNLVVGINGMLALATDEEAWISAWPSDERPVVVHAFYDDLVAMPSELGSALSAATFGTNGVRRFVIEYRAFGFYGVEAVETNSVSFQVAFAEEEPTVVRVCYFRANPQRDALSNRALGSNASLSALTDGRSLVYSNNSPVAQPGLALTYYLGTDTSPLLADTDDDGLGDAGELALGTEPSNHDTDGDGLPDGWETDTGLDPLDATDGAVDSDNDGLSNADEYLHGADPLDADTDGDGVDDGVEVAQGSDPCHAGDGVTAPEADALLPLPFHVYGDYAAWEMRIHATEGDTRTFRFSTNVPGQSNTRQFLLRKGASYEISLRWRGDGEHHDYEWYCWEAQVGNPLTPSSRCFNDYDPTRLDGNEILVGDGWICENADGLLTSHVHTHDEDGGNIAVGKTATLHVLGGALRADLDRDGAIGATENATPSSPLRMWLNNDDDSGAVQEDSVKDAPGEGSSDSGDNVVDGLSDLVDFFPVKIDFREALETIHGISGIDSSKVEVRLSCDGATLGCVETGFDADEAGKHLSDPNAGVGSAHVGHVGGGGTNLTQNFISAMRQDSAKGVVLLEGKTRSSEGTAAMLTAELRYDGTNVLAATLPVLVAPVEEFYRWYNFRAAAGGGVSYPTDTMNPAAPPNGATNGRAVVFVHGANVSEDSARGWAAEMFKRLWQSGADMDYNAFAWFSDKGPAYNYHENVSNAFVTAQSLAQTVNSLSGQRIVIAHSLGTLVAASAIQDHGMQVEKLIMHNSAIPSEAFDPSLSDPSPLNKLVHDEWVDYTNACWTSLWHEFFPTNDARGRLTWKGRFAEVNSAVENFYSSGDEVLEFFGQGHNPTWSDGFSPSEGMGRRYSWQKQELYKGRASTFGFAGTSDWAGWGFAENWLNVRIWSADEANAVTDLSVFTTNTVFMLEPPSITNSVATRFETDCFLAFGIPALSPPTGRTNLSEFGVTSRDMNGATFKPNGIPTQGHGDVYMNRWLHSDIKNLAFPYVRKAFDKILEVGGLE